MQHVQARVLTVLSALGLDHCRTRFAPCIDMLNGRDMAIVATDSSHQTADKGALTSMGVA